MSDQAESERNLELLEEAIEAYNRGDLSFAVARAGDDIEVFAHHELLNNGSYQGREAFERWLRERQEAGSEITIHVSSVQQQDHSQIHVDVHQHAVGAASGVPVDMDLFQLIEVRDAAIQRFHLYPDRGTALAALESME